LTWTNANTTSTSGDSYSRWDEGQTWVDYLQQHLQKQGNPPKTHNFAFRGATVESNLSDQLLSFTRLASEEANNKRPALGSDGTTYFMFLGINDCGNTECDELGSIVQEIFDTLRNLYVKARARNFVLVDIPPIDRSPQAIDAEVAEEMEERVKTWNELLQQQATEFGLANRDGTLLLFSSHQFLMDVLDDPLEYDFSEDDTTEVGGIWADDLHLTSEVHDILGEQLLTALTLQR